MEKYFSYQDVEIPEVPGVYAFYYAPFQSSRLGCYLDDPNRDVANLKKKVKNRIKSYEAFKRMNLLEVTAVRKNAAGLRFGVFSGELRAEGEQINFIDSLSDGCFYDYLAFFQGASFFFQPLYCGMTFEQGLKSRYYQHKKSYDIGKPSTFGGRLKEAGIQWGDLCLVAAGKFNSKSDRRDVMKLERFLISNSSPIFNVQ